LTQKILRIFNAKDPLKILETKHSMRILDTEDTKDLRNIKP
jgi:hypothetical protein